MGRHAWCLLVAQFFRRRKRPAGRDGGGASTTAREGPPLTSDPALNPDPVTIVIALTLAARCTGAHH
jgi:hypothetical protein